MAEALISRLKTTDDYYEILEVSRSASAKEIKVSYRKKAMRLHPDRCKLPEAKDAFQKLSNAHMCLSDPQKRRLYDVSGTDSSSSPAASSSPFAGFPGGHPFGRGFAGFPAGNVRFSTGAGIPWEDLFGEAARASGGRTTFSFSGFPGPTMRRRSNGSSRSNNSGGSSNSGADNNSSSGGAGEQSIPRVSLDPNSWAGRLQQGINRLQSQDSSGVVRGLLGILLCFLALVSLYLLSKHWTSLLIATMSNGGVGPRRLMSMLIFCMYHNSAILSNPVVFAIGVYFYVVDLPVVRPLANVLQMCSLATMVIFTCLGY